MIPRSARITRPFDNQLVEDSRDRIDRHGEADAGGLADLADDRRIHADDLAPRVEERAARVAGVDCGVGLDDPRDHPAVLGLERAIQAADDARGQRPLQAERVAQGQDLLADHQGRGIAERERNELLGRHVDHEDGHVVRGVGADDLGVVRPCRRRCVTRTGIEPNRLPGSTWKFVRMPALLVEHETGAGAGGGFVAEEAQATSASVVMLTTLLFAAA